MQCLLSALEWCKKNSWIFWFVKFSDKLQAGRLQQGIFFLKGSLTLYCHIGQLVRHLPGEQQSRDWYMQWCCLPRSFFQVEVYHGLVWCQYTVTDCDRKLIGYFCLSVAAHTTEQVCPWDTPACYWDIRQPTTSLALPGFRYSCPQCLISTSNNNNNHIQRRYLRFFTISSQCRKLSNTHAHVAQAESCANHVQHIERLSRATCRATCHLVRRDSSAIKFDRFEVAFIWALFCWLNR